MLCVGVPEATTCNMAASDLKAPPCIVTYFFFNQASSNVQKQVTTRCGASRSPLPLRPHLWKSRLLSTQTWDHSGWKTCIQRHASANGTYFKGPNSSEFKASGLTALFGLYPVLDHVNSTVIQRGALAAMKAPRHNVMPPSPHPLSPTCIKLYQYNIQLPPSLFCCGSGLDLVLFVF